MEDDKFLTNPSIMRLARKAGVKNFSVSCYPIVNIMIEEELKRILEAVKIVNGEKDTKTIMIGDVYQAFNLIGERVAYSEKLNGQTTKKN